VVDKNKIEKLNNDKVTHTNDLTFVVKQKKITSISIAIVSMSHFVNTKIKIKTNKKSR
jgi:hypothetical protein